MREIVYEKCRDHRPCFALEAGRCTILKNTYFESGECPFCKASADEITVTNRETDMPTWGSEAVA